MLLRVGEKLGRKNKIAPVFDYIREGHSLYAACRQAGFSTREFYQVLADNPSLKEDFQLALSDYADQCTDDIRALTQALRAGELDNSTAKLLIETNKWLAQKASPNDFAELERLDEEADKTTEIVVKFV